MKEQCIVTLKKSREKPILGGHPWIFSGAVQSIRGYGRAGDLCRVVDHKGRFLASGYVNTGSQITVRVLAAGEAAEAVTIDEDFLRASLERALSLRVALLGSSSVSGRKSAVRLVNAEGDFLPGLVVDHYAEGLVLQAHTAGMQRLKGLLVDCLRALLSPLFIYEKTDTRMAEAEGLEAFATSGTCLYGTLPPSIEIEETGARFHVDVAGGQKTGFYLDQRRNRKILREISEGTTLLNCFSYSGSFAVQALLGGALETLNVDLSQKALDQASSNAELNRIEPERFRISHANVFEFLRKDESSYDIVVLDPPKFASSKGELPGALRGYKDINLNALQRVRSGGFLMTFSCSGLVPEDLFQKVVFAAAADAERSVQILRRLHADVDHPVNLAHREGQYLKGLLLRVA